MMVRIGLLLGHDVWVPRQDRNKEIEAERIGEGCLASLEMVAPKRTLPIIELVDVIWLKKGSFSPVALFEIEHSTTIYSGLLRLNDVLIDYAAPRVGIVSFEKRRNLFQREIARRTFEKSGLTGRCKFYNYKTIHALLARLQSNQREARAISEELF
jgi:type II restriction enzyme